MTYDGFEEIMRFFNLI